jgi:Lar family restriction alleviation protein
MPMADLEILPCPFCGTAARHYTRKDESIWSHATVDWHYISCGHCEVEMHQCDGFDEVLARWNTREEPSLKA